MQCINNSTALSHETDIEAECQDDFMKIRVAFNGSFQGLIYSSGMLHIFSILSCLFCFLFCSFPFSYAKSTIYFSPNMVVGQCNKNTLIKDEVIFYASVCLCICVMLLMMTMTRKVSCRVAFKIELFVILFSILQECCDNFLICNLNYHIRFNFNESLQLHWEAAWGEIISCSVRA